MIGLTSPGRSSVVFGVVLTALLTGCGKAPVNPTARVPVSAPPTTGALRLPEGPPVRVLFVGNSLTAGHDVPGLVQALAAAGGVRVEYRASIIPGASLEDQWAAVGPRDALRETEFRFVVLQQGPSTLPESRENLTLWAGRWAEEARKHGAAPALYMVWPNRKQRDGVALAAQSYRAAADACGGKILPAGEAFREALAADPDVPLFDADDFHASEAGAYLASLVITHGLTGIRPSTAPDDLTLMSGARLSIPTPLAAKLRAAAETVVGPPAKPPK
ncbi:MAG TPA: SGNH/GDSL hydrolase family protein [Gemmata sp.]|nr:SGNH/GDSL hydrolase family protein [Gemmata sp.]